MVCENIFIALPRIMVEIGAFSHKIYYVTISLEILNLERASKLHYPLKSYGDFAEWVEWVELHREGFARSLHSRLVFIYIFSLEVLSTAKTL